MASCTSRKKVTHRLSTAPTDFRRVAERFKEISNVTRLTVLLLLGDGERSVGEISSTTRCTMTVVSRHLGLLRLVGLVVRTREGYFNVYALTALGRDMRRFVEGMVG
jgi:DNA-binding transcriptional ArsR family regulator